MKTLLFRATTTPPAAPAWLDDYFIGLFLLVAAEVFRRNPLRGRAWLVGAWGFCAGMLYGSIFGHLQHIHEPDPGTIPQVPLTVVIGLGFAASLAALAASLVAVGDER